MTTSHMACKAALGATRQTVHATKISSLGGLVWLGREDAAAFRPGGSLKGQRSNQLLLSCAATGVGERILAKKAEGGI